MKRIFLPFLVMVFIITASVTVTLNFRPLYYHDISSLNIEQTSGFSRKTIKDNYNALIDYNSMFHKGPLKLSLPMSEKGRIHFQEVKHIFIMVQAACLISFILLLYLGRQNIKSNNVSFLKHASTLTVVFPITAGLAVSANWDKAFILFHEVAFRNDYWIFDEAVDPIIKILPDAFFLHCAVMIILLILLGSLLCFGIFKYCSFFRHKSML